jgi:hypothetical protein
MRQRLLLAARSILAGWVTLLVIAYVLERPLLILIAGRLGGAWFPTFRLMLDCSVLAAIGWIVGRFGRPNPILAGAAFAASLTFWDLEELVEIRIPWLLHLAGDALRDSRYWESFFNTALVQAFLLGSLIGGALLSRRAPATLSVFDEVPREETPRR